MMNQQDMLPITFPHMTSFNPLPMMAFATVQYDWEWKYSLGDVQNRYSRELILLIFPQAIWLGCGRFRWQIKESWRTTSGHSGPLLPFGWYMSWMAMADGDPSGYLAQEQPEVV